MSVSRTLLVVSLSWLLTACSSDSSLGEGSGLLTIGYKIKQLAFSWSAAPVADTYRLLENRDGVSGYSQIGSDFPSTTTAYDYAIAVHLQDWNNASYILQSCIAGVCTDSPASMATNGTAAIGYLKASNTGFNDNFGQAVAVSDDGNTVAVGAWAEDGLSDSMANSGAAYVFSRVSDVWQGPDYLTASNAGSGDQFGNALALSRDGLTLAVAAWQEAGDGSSEINNSAAGAGAVYIFVRSSVGATWTQQAYLKASNVEAADNFGQALALSDDGNTLAVGAPGEDGSANAINGSGAVYTFTRSSGVWTQQAYLKASNAADNAGFGNAVSLSANGTVLAVAASFEDFGGNLNNGAAYVFSYPGATGWTEDTVLRASNAGSNDSFASSLALSADGTTLAAGAPFEDSDGAADNNNALDAGAVYVFHKVVSWSEQAKLKADFVESGDQFGWSVALGESSGNILAIGADQEDGSGTGVGAEPLLNNALGAGAGYVFTRTSGIWSQWTYLKAPNTEFGDHFASAMAMSGDGLTLAIGADNEDSGATGIGGSQSDNSLPDSGAVYLY